MNVTITAQLHFNFTFESKYDNLTICNYMKNKIYLYVTNHEKLQFMYSFLKEKPSMWRAAQRRSTLSLTRI